MMDLNLEPSSGVMYYAFSPRELCFPASQTRLDIARLPKASMLGIVAPFDLIEGSDLESGFESYDIFPGENGYIAAWWESADAVLPLDAYRTQIRRSATALKHPGALLYELRGNELLVVVKSWGRVRSPGYLRAILKSHGPLAYR
jgi:hypothetical protein